MVALGRAMGIIAAVAALLLVGRMAALIPARRARLTDPVVMLRQQVARAPES